MNKSMRYWMSTTSPQALMFGSGLYKPEPAKTARIPLEVDGEQVEIIMNLQRRDPYAR